MVMACWALLAAAARIDGPIQLTVVPETCRVTIEVGKAGVLSFAGHAHEILAPGATGTVIVDETDPSRSSVSLEFRTADLRVNDAGEPPGDAPQVQETMLGPRVLDAARFPSVSFRSSRVVVGARSADGADIRVEGAMTLHGVTRTVTLPLHVTLAPDGTPYSTEWHAFTTGSPATADVPHPVTQAPLTVEKATLVGGQAKLIVDLPVAGTDMTRHRLLGSFVVGVYLEGPQPVCAGSFELRGLP